MPELTIQCPVCDTTFKASIEKKDPVGEIVDCTECGCAFDVPPPPAKTAKKETSHTPRPVEPPPAPPVGKKSSLIDRVMGFFKK